MKFIFQILSMSLQGSLCIILVLGIRACLRKAPRKWSFLLWLAPAVRLICPLGLRAPLSIYSLTPLQAESVSNGNLLTILELNEETARLSDGVLPPSRGVHLSTLATVLGIIWAAGCVALITLYVVKEIQLNRRLRRAKPVETGVYESSEISSPLVHGLFKPIIYITDGLDEALLTPIFAHERYHIQRKDYIIKPIALFILIIHWFNPIVWLAFHFMNDDLETSCDEAVLAALTETGDVKQTLKNYSLAVLTVSAKTETWNDFLLSFGTVIVEKRIKHILSWKKSPRWTSALMAPLCAAIILGCALHPMPNEAFVIDGVTLSKAVFVEECTGDTQFQPLGIDHPIFEPATLRITQLTITKEEMLFHCIITCEGKTVDRFSAKGTVYRGIRGQVSDAKDLVLDIQEEENQTNILLFEVVEGESHNNYYLSKEQTAVSSIRIYVEKGEQLYLFEGVMPDQFADCFSSDYEQIDDPTKDFLWFAHFYNQTGRYDN